MISLPLAKLSTALDDNADAKQLTWKHDSRDLSVVIDTFGARGPPSQLLKIIQGTQILHLIEVERLVNEGKELIRAMQEHGVELKSEQLPISGLVRCPLLAIRWTLPTQKTQRIQLRLKSSQDFDTVFKHLNQLGLRLSPAHESTSRGSESSTHRLPASIVSTSQHRPVSASSSRATERTSRPYTALTAPTALEAELQEAAHVRPMSASSPRRIDLNFGPVALPASLKPPEIFLRPDPASSASASSFDETSSSAIRVHQFRVSESFSSPSLDRPDAALLYDRSGATEALLPPRRELPFSRTSLTLSSGSDRPSSRPDTALMGPPPLPARVNSLRPSSSRAQNQLSDLPALPKPTVVSTPVQQASWMKAAAHISQHIQIEAQGDKENSTTSGASPASSSPLPSKHTLSPTDPLDRPLSSLNNSARNQQRPESRSSLSTPPISDIQQYRTAPEDNSTEPSASSSDELAKYAMQSAEGRRASLNEFIFQCLEDENFITLVEDMETCYARIGFGMK